MAAGSNVSYRNQKRLQSELARYLEQSVTALSNKYNTRKRQGIGRVCKMVDNSIPVDNTVADFPDQLGDFA